jgi:hypothetical protein
MEARRWLRPSMVSVVRLRLLPARERLVQLLYAVRTPEILRELIKCLTKVAVHLQ